MMSGAMHGYDNTNVMLWRLGPEDATAATYIATTDFPLVHEVDPVSLAVTAYRTPSPIRDGLSMSSCSHWRREVGADSSLQFHQAPLANIEVLGDLPKFSEANSVVARGHFFTSLL